MTGHRLAVHGVHQATRLGASSHLMRSAVGLRADDTLRVTVSSGIEVASIGPAVVRRVVPPARCRAAGGADLGGSMSDYLIRELGAHDRIDVLLRTEVVDGGGSGHLEWLRDNASSHLRGFRQRACSS